MNRNIPLPPARRSGSAFTSGRPGPGRSAAVLGGVLSGLALVACSAPGSGSTAGTAAQTPTSVSTTLGSEPIELTLYDGAGLKAKDEALIAAFTKKYPNVKITGRYDPDDVQAQNAPRVLAGSNPPDIARIIALADVVKDRQLTNLDPYAKAYGWDKLPEGQLANFKASPEGVRGTGSQYTVADGFTVTGYYYNKKLMQQLGASAPTTLEELEALLAKAKAAGMTPIMAGNQTGQVVFSLQSMLNATLGREAINEWVFHAPDASIDTPEAVEAVERFTTWVKAGYFPKDTNGTDGTAALGRFARGEGLLFASGNWDAAALEKQMPGNVGFFLPPAAEGRKPATMSDPASNFGIPARADQKDAAAAFLNFLLSPEARQVVADTGFAPSGTGELPRTKPGSLNTDVQKAYADLVEAGGQVQFVQNATNGINATWLSQSQLLVAGRTSPAELLKQVQGQYEKELGR
jgi:raffinose/stachyose/melibiose transport system substrate-binding protein